MSFEVTATQKPRLAKAAGSFTELVVGTHKMTTASDTITVYALSRVDGFVLQPQGTTATGYCSANTANTFTVAGVTDLLFNYIVWGAGPRY